MKRSVQTWWWTLCGSLVLATSCVTHRGSWRRAPAPRDVPVRSGVELVLLANFAPEDRDARAVAARVQELVRDDHPRVVLWLGNLAAAPRRATTRRAQQRGPDCLDPQEAWSSPAMVSLARAIEPLASEGRSFAVPGVLDHRCDHRLSSNIEDAYPFHLPASHYIVRVHADGATQVRARCSDGGCTFDAYEPISTSRALVDLVIVDLSPWLYPSDDASSLARDELQVLALASLLTTIAGSPPETGPPRLLVSSVPVEAAGEHGLGALWPDATFHTLPEKLQELLVQGYFSGVLSAYDRSLMATDDLSDAIKRADRAWLRAPLFQVGAGAVAAPNQRARMSRRRHRVRESQAYRSPAFSDHAGFATVRVRATEADLVLHALVGQHWETQTITVPLRPAQHPVRTPSPQMTPCRDCPPIPASER